MAALSHTEQFTAPLAPDAVRQRILDWFARYRPRVDESENKLEIKTGSQLKMRMIGGAFIAGSSLPTRTTVTLTPSGGATNVSVVAEDTVTVGVKFGMKHKYETWLAEIGTGLKAACAT